MTCLLFLVKFHILLLNRFKFVLLAVLFVLVLETQGQVTELEACNCWEGYKPERKADGSVHCAGTQVFAIKPCNMPRPPRCVCTGHVSSILTDHEGTWCAVFEKGVEKKRWACENTNDWDTFNKENPGFFS